MTKLRNQRILLGSLAAALILAGCQSRQQENPVVAIAPTPKPVEEPAKPAPPKLANVDGKWVPRDAAARAIYYNEFRGGKFGAYSADGNTTLAVGTYKPTENGATLKYYSQSQQRDVTATCVKQSDTAMTCTTNSGSVAELVRG